MLLILSAQLVNEDIALQYGGLPPSFLPLGKERLFSQQVRLAAGQPCFMTLPEHFEIPPTDSIELAAQGVKVIRQPTNLSLTQAIANALKQIQAQEPITILYGDTLVSMPELNVLDVDTVAVHETTANYPWAYVKEIEKGYCQFFDNPPEGFSTRQVLCGYFSISDPLLLIEACGEKSVVAALNRYSSKKRIKSVHAETWFDFGHLPLYYQSRQNVFVQRAFNSLFYEKKLLIKQSSDASKMRAEAHWYENLPDELTLHTPRYCGRVERNHRAGYALEYLYIPQLGELFAFGDLPLTSWLEILSKCFEVIKLSQDIQPAGGAPESSPAFADHFFKTLLIEKSWARVRRYCSSGDLELNSVLTINGQQHPALNDVIQGLIDNLRPSVSDDICFWHGDLFFGNLFYDFTAQRILAIDPRGHIGFGEFSLYGDRRYDIAKLCHSIVGRYDQIILGRSELIEEAPLVWRFEVERHTHQTEIENAFIDFVRDDCGLVYEDILRMTALFFFSMLPLHDDRPDLQKQFLATGLKIAAKARKEKT